METEPDKLFAPVCSVTKTKRRRFFWAAWWTGPPSRSPFRKPDACDGGEATLEAAVAAAERRAGTRLVLVDPMWARAVIRTLRGEAPWLSASSREPRRSPVEAGAPGPSIWEVLGVSREATALELKAAFRQRARETHPDQGGDAASFRRVLRAYEEAERRLRRRGRR